MKKEYISPSTEKITVNAEPLLNPQTGVPNSDQDDDGGRAKNNDLSEENSYWDMQWHNNIWDE